MNKLVEHINNKNYKEADETLAESFHTILEKKMWEMKKRVAAKMGEQNTHKERMRRLRADVLEEEPEDGEESSMARSELQAITKDAKTIMSKIKGNKELEAWTQSKITKAADYMNAVADYMEDEGQIDEQETYDPATGNTTKRTQSSTSIRLNKYGQEKKAHEPDEEGDETHIHKKNITTTTGNNGEKSSVLTRRMSDTVVRPDKGDGKGGDYSVSSQNDLEKTSDERKPDKSYIPGVTPVSEEIVDKNTRQSLQMDEQRINIVKARVRGGKIQRRVKTSNVAGMTMRGGQLTRMSAAERRRRKLGAKRAARKTKMKRTQMLRKRKMSLMKRQRLGI